MPAGASLTEIKILEFSSSAAAQTASSDMPSKREPPPPSDDDLAMTDAPAESPVHEEEDPNPTNLAFSEDRIRLVSIIPLLPCLFSLHARLTLRVPAARQPRRYCSLVRIQKGGPYPGQCSEVYNHEEVRSLSLLSSSFSRSCKQRYLRKRYDSTNVSAC